MATMRDKKIAAVSREAPENTTNIQSQNTLDPGVAQSEAAGFLKRLMGEPL